jgi:hypothetical protein
VRELEADRDALLASYAEVVPEVLNSLSREERSKVYRMLQLEVRPNPEGYEVSGAFVIEGRWANVVPVLRKARRVPRLPESPLG